MKKVSCSLLAALLLASVATPGLAQVGLSVGPRFGIGFANVGGDLEDTNSNFGLSFGGSFGLQLHDYFRLAIDGQWVQKGFSEEEVVDIDGFVEVDASFNVSYIEFMVPATLTIPIPESPITPRLYVGPALAIEVSCGVSGNVAGVEVNLDCDEAGAETKSTDFLIFFGGGVDVAVGIGAITVDLLYDLGLTDLNDVTGDPTSIKSRNFQVLAGYRFFFGG
ncbi:MAG: hypothetical protein AMS25_02595 [Gemmatimonas sp. SM23_52]|nr:MAG: hypothetical protein AMS25_02595 [Gemmatimonas sp. SM23_52]